MKVRAFAASQSTQIEFSFVTGQDLTRAEKVQANARPQLPRLFWDICISAAAKADSLLLLFCGTPEVVPCYRTLAEHRHSAPSVGVPAMPRHCTGMGEAACSLDRQFGGF